jgi:NDP-sugar pyrophosphorylase family protein
MDHLLDRLEAAPCDEIRVVTRPEKEDVAVHAHAWGASVVSATPSSVSESLMAGIAGCPDDDLIVFGFPDTLWEPLDGFAQLMAALEPEFDAALGVFRTREPSRSDTVGVHGNRVVWIDVKPARPHSDLVWGCAVARARVVRAFAGEAEPGRCLDRLARQGRVAAVRLLDPFVDIGTPQALAAVSAEA